MIRTVFLWISSWLFIISTAQAQEFKLGKIDKKDFEKTAEIIDSTASAIILKHYRETHFEYDGAKGWIIITKVQERIKILKKEGTSYGTHKVGAYKRNGDEESVIKIDGYTYALENDRLREERLNKGAIFEQQESEYRDSYTWTMPNVQVGSIVEWEYTLKSPFWKIDDLKMQQDIPVAAYTAVIRTPSIFQFNKLKKGYFEVKPETEFKKRSDGVMIGQNTGYGRSAINSKSANMTFTEQVDTYKLENIAALQEEAFIDNIENYRYTVIYELSSLQHGDGSVKNYATSWDDVAKSIFEAEHFGKQLDKTNFLNADADNIKRKGTGKELLLKNTYEFVRDNFAWNDKYGKYVEDDLKDVYKTRSGNAAEINLTLIAMLNACGVAANPVLVSTKENGIPMFPTLEGFNYVIAGVELGEGLILLDATEKFGNPNILPERVYNWKGRLVKKNGTSRAVDLYPKKPAQQDFLLNYAILENGKIAGNMMQRYTALNALDFRKKNKGSSPEKIKQQLINELKIDQIENLQLKDVDALDRPIIESYDFQVENAYDQVGNSIYLSPMLFIKLDETPFKLKERQFPVNFSFPFVVTKRISLKIPVGYQVESLPESVHIALPEDMGSFIYKIRLNQNVLNLSVEFTINNSVIPVNFYSTLRDFYATRVTKENEKVVLTKL